MLLMGQITPVMVVLMKVNIQLTLSVNKFHPLTFASLHGAEMLSPQAQYTCCDAFLAFS